MTLASQVSLQGVLDQEFKDSDELLTCFANVQTIEDYLRCADLAEKFNQKYGGQSLLTIELNEQEKQALS